ncbi:MAG: oligosaccharide flippase family protein [Candidatus Moranbacteria bacterium]|nr:oligosaccharide flippase family protein [Candidatus Moranbacteria bacterium]
MNEFVEYGIKLVFKRILIILKNFFKIDFTYFAKGAFWLLVAQIAGLAGSMMITWMMANFIEKSTYGYYQYVLAIVNILIIASLPGMNISALRSASRGFEGTLKKVFKIKIKWGFIGCLVSLLIAYYYSYHNRELAITFFVSSFFIPFLDTTRVPISLLAARKLFNLESAILNYLINISIVLVVIAGLIFSKSLLAIVSFYLIANIGVRWVAGIYIEKRYKPNNITEDDAIRHGWHLSLIQAIVSISGNIGNIGLAHFLGNISLAVYAIAIGPIEQIRSLIGINDLLYMPKFSNDDWEIPKFREFFIKIAPFVVVLVAVTACYIFLIPYLFKYIFPKYMDAVFYSQLYSIMLVPSAIGMVLNNIIKSKMLIKEQHLINYLNSALSFVLNIPAIYFFGIIGLIFATIINKFIEVSVLSYMLFANKKH